MVASLSLEDGPVCLSVEAALMPQHPSCQVTLTPSPCPHSLLSSHSDAFAKLLESGDLSMNSIKVDGISMSFQNLLAKICFYHHFSGK